MSYSKAINKALSDGARLYSSKEYELASEKYAEACEKYQEENGKDDADLLLLYGKSLFQSAVSNSEVFGQASGNQNQEKETVEDKEIDNDDGNFQFHEDGPLAEAEDDLPEIGVKEDDSRMDDERVVLGGDHDDENDEGDHEEQSDFEVAWEILDLARSLFEKQLKEILHDSESLAVPYLTSDREDTNNDFIKLTKKLSETYDILGEVSLEAENFPQSAIDLENSLNLRLKLYDPKWSALISESHYKLSLALEFCVEDSKLRQKAADHMKLAIDSVKERNKDEKDELKRKENEELLQDLEIRYLELKKDPTEEFKEEQLDIIKGILGEATSESSSGDGKPARNVVNDLSSVVKKKSSGPVTNLTSLTRKRKNAGKGDSTDSGSKKSKS
ncbi:uncharacterized protein PRCAT00005406001 [Priceomyces carsonii]|uniref:uncharacterized protein n=1 Tax=Priceomyces carsonii TaxID=28549 RepID=UPI002ED82780|nr:unnamed protein product [Priceomyces carsonii]